ncbi:c-type cytochrome [Tsuneonella sp. HG249]
MFKSAFPLACVMALAGCGQAATESDNPQIDPAAAPPSEAVAAAPSAATAAAPASFVQCKTCHSVEPGRNLIGPSLAGIHGKPAGSVQGYAYSAAMKGSGLVWDDATLDRFLDTPMKTVPGTKMVYPGLKDPAKRAEVVAYLKTI